MQLDAPESRTRRRVGQCTGEGPEARLDFVLQSGDPQAHWIFLPVRPCRSGVRRHMKSLERTGEYGRANSLYNRRLAPTGRCRGYRRGAILDLDDHEDAGRVPLRCFVLAAGGTTLDHRSQLAGVDCLPPNFGIGGRRDGS